MAFSDHLVSRLGMRAGKGKELRLELSPPSAGKGVSFMFGFDVVGCLHPIQVFCAFSELFPATTLNHQKSAWINSGAIIGLWPACRRPAHGRRPGRLLDDSAVR
jgi:hypothetical protein